MLEKENFFPIGIGTYKLNLEDEKNTLDGLLYSFEKGQNFMSTALVYDNGKIDWNETGDGTVIDQLANQF